VVLCTIVSCWIQRPWLLSWDKQDRKRELTERTSNLMKTQAASPRVTKGVLAQGSRGRWASVQFFRRCHTELGDESNVQ